MRRPSHHTVPYPLGPTHASNLKLLESLLVRGLVVLTDESGCQLYCGRPAGGLGFTSSDGRPGAGEDGS